MEERTIMNKTDKLISITFSILSIMFIISYKSQGYINGVSIWNLQSFILAPVLIILGCIDLKEKNMRGLINIILGIIQIILIINNFLL